MAYGQGSMTDEEYETFLVERREAAEVYRDLDQRLTAVREEAMRYRIAHAPRLRETPSPLEERARKVLFNRKYYTQEYWDEVAAMDEKFVEEHSE